MVNGGQYHAEGFYNVWDFVYFHDPDPAVGANTVFAASQWLDIFCSEILSHCSQIVSASAILGWSENLSSGGSSVRVSGSPDILNQDL